MRDPNVESPFMDAGTITSDTSAGTSPVRQPIRHGIMPSKPVSTQSPLLALSVRDDDAPSVSWREILCVFVIVILSDIAIYRAEGFAGFALFFVGAPILLLFGAPQLERNGWTLLLGCMLTLLAAKTVWLGSSLLAGVGGALLVAFAMSLSHLPPYVLEIAVFASQTILAGYHGLVRYGRFVTQKGPSLTRTNWLNIGLPLVTLVGFGMLFILANPDLLASFDESVSQLLRTLRTWLLQYSPAPWEVVFWLSVLWIAVGLLRPVVRDAPLTEEPSHSSRTQSKLNLEAKAALYTAFRNTLIMVIALFAIYLVFEFKTLWFRVFPKGFYYSGYAHQGAAWLTVALALSTVILSIVFRGSILNDFRLPRLRRLAWIWSLENILLAVAVYHRLFIYIGFNGMSRMRVVGLFGISAVVAGFILVLWKIAREHDFLWLFRHHLWALSVAVYLFAITPVDIVVVKYNVQRILAGDPAPSVQISVHPIGPDGILFLQPLLNCQDVTIREGVRAMLAQRHEQAENLATVHDRLGWTTFQLSECILLRKLRSNQANWTRYADPRERQATLEQFHKYAYQWY